MELNDRETLIKVEQQLTNSIENQKLISEELRGFLKKLERNDKALALFQIDLKTHISEAPLRRDALSNKLKYITQTIDELKKISEKIKTKYDIELKDFEKKIEDLEGSLITEKTERGTFETTVKTSARSFKVFISIIVGFFSFLVILFKLLPVIIRLFQ